MGIPRTLIALLAFASPVLAADPPSPRTLSVSGEGRAQAAPDLAVVSFAVETTAPTAGAAVTDNAKKSTALAEAVKAKLGPRDKVYTTQYSLMPRYEQQERNLGGQVVPRIIGYVASNAVRVELRDVRNVGALIDAATGAGANRVDSLEFTLEERAAAQSEALKLAGADAKRQAEAAAAALGVSLGKVLTANTGSAPIIMPKQMARMAMAADVATPVEAGDVTVSATLQVTYEIQ
ncbi:MAG: SIMPL domain-containing protein [Deltaproteobacteria bacterium]|nr:SIMPL domain-containing protein [Deltaproteobacteria bacterium]